MKVPFVDLKTQYNSIKEEVGAAINEVLDNTAYILGKSVYNFEDKFAKAHGLKHCFGVSSGTDGNHLAIWSLGISAGDEVIIPANTFIATAWGTTLCGAKPVFADCHPDSYNIDASKIENLITPNTKAIVAVHLYGQPADMDELKKIAARHNIHLVEDCAQAHLSEYKGTRVGSFGITSSFSFYPGKNLGAYGEGGAVCTNDDEIASKLKMMREHGSHEKYTHLVYGHNYRMEGIQGAVLGVKMNHIEKWTEERRSAASLYKKYFKDIPEVILPKEMDYSKHVYHLFVIRTTSSEIRNKLQAYLSEKGIATGLHYPIPLHLQPCFSHLNYKKGDMPVSENLADCGLSLPIYPELSEEQIIYISDCVKSFYN
ncbi:MAG: DegT/DnrJ/EryC1/StrS family aminotransferase [Ignavibacteria bacterium]|nr:DegT/DnrJ/EryC1/StrS family aminotransferase [Ignavibacteria bacterium]